MNNSKSLETTAAMRCGSMSNQNNTTMKKSLFEQWKDGEIGGFGSFQTAIFNAYKLADDGNQKLLNEAFPDWFKPYPVKEA